MSRVAGGDEVVSPPKLRSETLADDGEGRYFQVPVPCVSRPANGRHAPRSIPGRRFWMCGRVDLGPFLPVGSNTRQNSSTPNEGAFQQSGLSAALDQAVGHCSDRGRYFQPRRCLGIVECPVMMID
jgi:hypothetical protein